MPSGLAGRWKRPSRLRVQRRLSRRLFRSWLFGRSGGLGRRFLGSGFGCSCLFGRCSFLGYSGFLGGRCLFGWCSFLGYNGFLGGCCLFGWCSFLGYNGFLGGRCLFGWCSFLGYNGFLGGCCLFGWCSFLGYNGFLGGRCLFGWCSFLGYNSFFGGSSFLSRCSLFRDGLLGGRFLRSCHFSLLDQVELSTAGNALCLLDRTKRFMVLARWPTP